MTGGDPAVGMVSGAGGRRLWPIRTRSGVTRGVVAIFFFSRDCIDQRVRVLWSTRGRWKAPRRMPQDLAWRSAPRWPLRA